MGTMARYMLWCFAVISFAYLALAEIDPAMIENTEEETPLIDPALIENTEEETPLIDPALIENTDEETPLIEASSELRICAAQAGRIRPLLYNSGRWVNIFGDVRFPCSGRLSHWQFYAKSYGTIFLTVWRAVGYESWTYVGYNEVVVDRSAINSTQIFRVPKESQISVEEGDVIGIMYPREDPDSTIPRDRGIIPYENDEDFQWDNPLGLVDTSWFPFSRIYNVQVYADALDLSQPQSGVRHFKRRAAFKAYVNTEAEIPDPCKPNPCMNGGVCSPDGDGGYVCDCPPLWVGNECQEPDRPGYDCEDNNPCTPQNIANERFYHPHLDRNKFVQCDKFGGCFVMPCPPGLVWDPRAYTCNYPRRPPRP